MTALCPMDRGPRGNFHADRTAARLITREEGEAALQSLWDTAATGDPGGMDDAAALGASVRLAAICQMHRAVNARASAPHAAEVMRREADVMDALADEFMDVGEYL